MFLMNCDIIIVSLISPNSHRCDSALPDLGRIQAEGVGRQQLAASTRLHTPGNGLARHPCAHF